LSYDLYMLDPEPSVNPMDTLERLDEHAEASPLDPSLLERNRRLAEALKTLDPDCEASEIGHAVLAEQQGISSTRPGAAPERAADG